MVVLGEGAVPYERGASVGTSNCGIKSCFFFSLEKTSGCSPCHEVSRSVCETCFGDAPFAWPSLDRYDGALYL